MDSTDRVFEEITRPFRAQLEALLAQPTPPPAPEPRWRSVAAAIGGALLGLAGLAAMAGALWVLAFAAHHGWRFAG
jgi:hypothetical protein